jgi:hypothetical protein
MEGKCEDSLFFYLKEEKYQVNQTLPERHDREDNTSEKATVCSIHGLGKSL